MIQEDKNPHHLQNDFIEDSENLKPHIKHSGRPKKTNRLKLTKFKEHGNTESIIEFIKNTSIYRRLTELGKKNLTNDKQLDLFLEVNALHPYKTTNVNNTSDSSESEYQPLPSPIFIEIENIATPLPNIDKSLEPMALRRLYVETPEDVLELTPQELEIVWRHRNRLCGTVQAAAEVYAFLLLNKKEIEFYFGYESYLKDPRVMEAGKLLPYIDELEDIFDETSCNSTEDKFPQIIIKTNQNTQTPNTGKTKETIYPEHQENKKFQPPQNTSNTLTPINLNSTSNQTNEFKKDSEHQTLGIKDIEHLSHDKLYSAWQKRRFIFSDLNAAAAALARLRFENKSDPSKKSWRLYLNHPLIIELSDFLPESHLSSEKYILTKESTLGMEHDARNYVVRRMATREGQANFRQRLISIYGARCCITGNEDLELLQAAHILPYKGEHTNETCNGLLLRVDLHLFFDAYKLSINPDTFTLEVVQTVTDKYYRMLDGKKLFSTGPAPNKDYLRQHYHKFRLINGIDFPNL